MSGLRKAKKYDWKDSNMALFGSDTDKAVKKESAETEKAWTEAKVMAENGGVGTLIWRIVKFKVTPWAKEDYGQFFSGDSYIIYHQKPKDDNPDALEMHVHFWIGKESTQDEYGTAAYKTVELDTLMDDIPVQHREVQGHEGDLFKTYFPSITLLKGGADSGFRHVSPVEYKARLFRFCRQSRKEGVVISELGICRKNVTSEDVYILDNGTKIYQFNGNASSCYERLKAAQYLNQLGDTRNGKATKDTLDEDETSSSHEFFQLLDEHENEDDDDDDAEDQNDGVAITKVLYRLSDESGTITFTKVKEGNITRDDFQPQDVFIYDTGFSLWVWVGGGASAGEKRNGFAYAHKYLQGTDHPFIPITVEKDGNESADFKAAL